jgi:hypothetical protein
MNPFYHFHWSFKILINLWNLIECIYWITITSLETSKKKKFQIIKLNNFINITYFLHTYTHTSLFNTLYKYLYTNILLYPL